MSLNNIFDVAGSGMNAQSVRLNTTASNIANADTASSSTEDVYRARHPVFKASFNQMLGHSQEGLNPQDETAGVAVLGIVESDAPLQPRYEPDHPMANEDGYVYYPNVNVVEEMTNMISASRSFQMNVDVLNSAKQMMQRVLSIGQ
ncbi:flagellar basal body rod protein FlgC [Marinagarivorans cellulosilyticus]|uniref:Flagellar basal-body rod protein FlgC n=1 Tax=Marinagarivorans cellulosilyticus TaxID=2721545 RepID=A0AAN1WKL4_9GAMM|nr:flagellar basal body rod protein FlgC [Marinagarivorans cellulosilyticus]BCD99305.1 flagellar basal-body rod protein FlgC [Marinagarivorans cellulosilyticus]